LSGADVHPNLVETGFGHEMTEVVVREAEAGVAKPIADPRLGVFAQVEHQYTAARAEHPGRLFQGVVGMVSVVQCL
jgi:hypothetical protein